MNVWIEPECFHRHLSLCPDLEFPRSPGRDQQVPDDGVTEHSDFPRIK